MNNMIIANSRPGLLCLLALLALNSCNLSPKNVPSEDRVAKTDASVTDPLAPPPPPPVPESKWEYSEQEDKMTSSTIYIAAIEANEQLQFHAPYDGGTVVRLSVRKKGNAQDVMLQISQGQFLSNIGEDRYVKVRFDDKAAMNFSYSDPSDYSSETIFINNEAKFIANIKKSRKVIIQSEFYDEGLQTMEFNVEGLKWEH